MTKEYLIFSQFCLLKVLNCYESCKTCNENIIGTEELHQCSSCKNEGDNKYYEFHFAYENEKGYFNCYKEEDKYNEEQIKQIEEKKAKDANTQLLLIRVLKNVYNKYGPLNNIINKENSEENEIKNILSLSEKYNLPISEEIEKNDKVEDEAMKNSKKKK